MIFLALRLLLLRWALFADTFRKVIKHERIAHRIRYAFNAYRYCFFFSLLIVTKNLFLFDHRLAFFYSFIGWSDDRWIIIFRCNSFMVFKIGLQSFSLLSIEPTIAIAALFFYAYFFFPFFFWCCFVI